MEKWTSSIVSPEPYYQARMMNAIWKLFLHRLTVEDYEKEMRSIRYSRKLDKWRKY